MAEDEAPIVVVGPGAVGSMLAARLQAGLPGRSVHLAGPARPRPGTAAHLAAVGESGVVIHGEAAPPARPLVRRGAMSAAASHLFFTVKAGRLAEAAAEFSGMAGRETVTAVFSNGLDVCGSLPASLRARGVVRGLVNAGAEIAGPGSVRQFGALDLTLAPAPGGAEEADFARVRRLAGLFEAAGIRVRRKRDGKEAEWRKAAANAIINPLGAALGFRNGALLDAPSSALVETLARELQALVDAEGMALAVLEIVRETARATAGNRNSMWQDLRQRRRTEIREITGRFLERAEARGVSMPAHESLYRRMLALEQDALRRGGGARLDIGGRKP